jgi:DNA-binding LacI/PurR family transcriptional regulator
VKRFNNTLLRKTSGRDVARLAGVSRTTVSYVLNGRADTAIPEATRQRVLRAAAQLGYRPNGVARSLVSGKTQTIGVIVPVLNSSFSAGIVNGIQQICSRGSLPYRMLLAYSHNDADEEVRQAQMLLEHRVDGLICVAGEHSVVGTTRWLVDAVKEGVPCVVVDDRVPGCAVDYVVSDDFNGARFAVEHLIGLGHRRIAHLSAGTDSSPARERLEGYRAALTAASIAVDERLIAGDSFDPGNAPRAMEYLLDLPEPPTAVFAANDFMAAAAFEADVSPAEYLRLTTVHQAPEELGRRATERLFERMENPELPPEGIVIPTHLVVRQSCGASQSASHR